MASIRHILNRAFSKAGIKSSGQDLETDDYDTGLDVLNDMMTALAADGVHLGYTVSSSVDSEFTCPDWAHAMAKANVAIRLDGEYEQEISPILMAEVDKTMRDIVERTIDIPEAYLPPTLPMGAGNCPSAGSSWGNDFYGDRSSDDLLLGTGQPALDGEGDVLET